MRHNLLPCTSRHTSERYPSTATPSGFRRHALLRFEVPPNRRVLSAWRWPTPPKPPHAQPDPVPRDEPRHVSTATCAAKQGLASLEPVRLLRKRDVSICSRRRARSNSVGLPRIEGGGSWLVVRAWLCGGSSLLPVVGWFVPDLLAPFGWDGVGIRELGRGVGRGSLVGVGRRARPRVWPSGGSRSSEACSRRARPGLSFHVEQRTERAAGSTPWKKRTRHSPNQPSCSEAHQAISRA